MDNISFIAAFDCKETGDYIDISSFTEQIGLPPIRISNPIWNKYILPDDHRAFDIVQAFLSAIDEVERKLIEFDVDIETGGCSEKILLEATCEYGGTINIDLRGTNDGLDI